MSLRRNTSDHRVRDGGEDNLLLHENILKNGNNLLSINSTMNSKGWCVFINYHIREMELL